MRKIQSICPTDCKATENPFLHEARIHLKLGKRKIHSKSPGPCAIKEATGEVVGHANFYLHLAADHSSFLKLFPYCFEIIPLLSKSGLKMLCVLFQEMQKTKNSDQVFLHGSQVREKYVLSESTYFRGIKNLIKHRFIAEKPHQFVYFININYVFNGDRLRCIPETKI